MDETRRVITSEPENSETPLLESTSWVTPNRLFFVRNHFDVPDIDTRVWRLKVGGNVDKPLELSLDDLEKMEQRSVFATVECAGNGRSFLAERVDGVQWGAGAIGHAEWTGVPVKDVLELAGLAKDQQEVVFQGADMGAEPDHPQDMHFERSLPMSKALHPDTLLALRMNGEALEPNHGFPCRLYVPGWYGVASVKWLQSIEVIDDHFDGYFQSKKYTVDYDSPDAPGRRQIVGPMIVKSEIIRPAAGASVGVGTNRISGVAWAGEQEIDQIEVSTDGGRSWNETRLHGLRAPYSWVQWEYLWEVDAPGGYILTARARLTTGECQPDRHDSRHGGYMINFPRRIMVTVEASRSANDTAGDAEALYYDMDVFAEQNTQRPLDVEMDIVFADGAGI